MSRKFTKIAIAYEFDDEIVLLSNKLFAQKEQKKGLMQVLLTGKVRVKA